jgi:predicted O-methyltransferase YrrM
MSVINELTTLLGGSTIDAVFIDAGHTYDDILQDFSNYRKLVGDGGIIGVHDIAPKNIDKEIGVGRFWQEIKQQYKTDEHVPSQKTMGIGVIYI